MREYCEIKCSEACHRIKSGFPYKWDLNIYRGCEHRCVYCFAVYSHRYIGGGGGFFDNIYVKANIAERLEKQISSPNWKRERVNLGGVTDNYQPAEARYRLMRDVLKTLIKYRNPCYVSTKSKLILRDLDLFEELAYYTEVRVAATITCMDEEIRRKIEPGAASSADRFAALKELKRVGADVGVHFMPAIPYLTDSDENIEGICKSARDIGADYIISCPLNLRGETKANFYEFLIREYPEKLERIKALYKDGGYVPKEFAAGYYERFALVAEKYGLNRKYRARGGGASAEPENIDEYEQIGFI